MRFEEHRVEQIRYAYPEQSFEKSRQSLSEWSELIYRNALILWITAFSDPWSAEMLKWLHPMRAGKATFSEKLNPWMFLIASWAAAIQSARMAVDDTNPFIPVKRAAGRTISQLLDGNRTSRDTVSKELFKTIYVVPKK